MLHTLYISQVEELLKSQSHKRQKTSGANSLTRVIMLPVLVCLFSKQLHSTGTLSFWPSPPTAYSPRIDSGRPRPCSLRQSKLLVSSRSAAQRRDQNILKIFRPLAAIAICIVFFVLIALLISSVACLILSFWQAFLSLAIQYPADVHVVLHVVDLL